ncbi:YopX protein [compost metagenome]
MREYRFRGKRIDNGEWVYGDLWQHNGRMDIVDSKADSHPVDPKTVGQYTGLQDRNGKEIYEGDILTALKYPFQDDGKYNYHGVIEWVDEEASFYMTKRLANKDKRGTLDWISQPIEEIEEFEVIGNIYEHPHLLEVSHG